MNVGFFITIITNLPSSSSSFLYFYHIDVCIDSSTRRRKKSRFEIFIPKFQPIVTDDNILVMSFFSFSSSSLACSFLCLTFFSRTKYLRSSVNKKLGPDRDDGNDDDKGKREGEREREERKNEIPY